MPPASRKLLIILLGVSLRSYFNMVGIDAAAGVAAMSGGGLSVQNVVAETISLKLSTQGRYITRPFRVCFKNTLFH